MQPVPLDELLHTQDDMMRRFRIKKSFNSLNAVHELFTYAVKYISEVRRNGRKYINFWTTLRFNCYRPLMYSIVSYI